MDEFGQHVKDRLHVELDGAGPSPAFWRDLQARRTVRTRRRIAGQVVAVAAGVAILAVGGVTLFGQLAPAPQVPPVTSQPDPAPIPSTATRVAEGTLSSGATWTLDIAGPDAWEDARGDDGDLCVRTVISRVRDAFSDGNYSVNCAPPETEGVFDSGIDGLVAVRNQPQAHTIEFRYDDGSTQGVPMRLHESNYGASWAIADLSDTSLEERVDGLAEIAVLNPDGSELILGGANEGILEGGPPSEE